MNTTPYLCLMVHRDPVSLVCFTTVIYLCLMGLFYNCIYLCLKVGHDNVSLVCFTTLYICVSWYVMIMSHWSVLQHYTSVSHGSVLQHYISESHGSLCVLGLFYNIILLCLINSMTHGIYF